MEHNAIRREFFQYTSQNMLGMMGLSCYILADTYFISQGLGADGLTALNLAIPFYNFIQGFGLMLGMGGATKFSLLRGRGQEGEAQGVFTRSLALALLTSLIFVIPGLCFAPQLSALLGGTGAVHGMTATYLRVLLTFAPAFLVNNVTLCFVRNDGAPRLAMAAMLGGSFSNIVLDYIFIFPCGMGMFGAVFATGLAPVISLVILSGHFRKGTLTLRRTGLNFRGTGEQVMLGAPSLISELSSGLVLVLFNFIILGLAGNLGVAGYGVVANIYLVVVALFTGLGQGIQPLVSSAWGRGEEHTARTVYRYAVLAALGMAAVLYAGSGAPVRPHRGRLQPGGGPHPPGDRRPGPEAVLPGLLLRRLQHRHGGVLRLSGKGPLRLPGVHPPGLRPHRPPGPGHVPAAGDGRGVAQRPGDRGPHRPGGGGPPAPEPAEGAERPLTGAALCAMLGPTQNRKDWWDDAQVLLLTP